MLAPMEEVVALPLGDDVMRRVTGAIAGLPPGRLRPSDVTIPALELFGTWDTACYYAPLDHLELSARVVLVSVCPPLGLAVSAHEAARDAIQAGLSRVEAWRRAALAAGPSGTFRTNLTRMLDDLGVASGLGLDTVAEAMGAESGLVQMSYCVRYPLLVNDRDYTGRRPRLLGWPATRAFVEGLLAPDLESRPEALVIPLGRIAAEAVGTLIESGRVSVDRCLLGVPNPSGANGHREDDFERSRYELTMQVAAWFRGHPGASPSLVSSA